MLSQFANNNYWHYYDNKLSQSAKTHLHIKCHLNDYWCFAQGKVSLKCSELYIFTYMHIYVYIFVYIYNKFLVPNNV